MADDSAIKEMISAFAIGCMDKENYTQFRNYIENKGKLPKGELGDLQNIISLIPTILDIEKPSENLKNELGNMLIQIQKDIKNKVVENRRETRIDVTDEFIKRDESTKVFDVTEKRMEHTRQTFVEEIPPQPVVSKPVTQKPEPPKRENVTRLNTTPALVQEKNSFGGIIHWLFSGILLVAIIILYFLFSGKISNLEETKTGLESKVVKLRTDVSRLDEFIIKNNEFVEFFNNPYIEIIPLKGTSTTSKETGRVFLSLGSGDGLLQLQNMPHLEPDMVFKLWLVSKSGTFSLGKFEVKPDKKFMPITEIPFVLKEDIEMFTVTKEMKDSGLTPNGETILFGSLRKELPPVKKRRR